mmetsp:Transcript_30491/g.76542  ORF Transcript_30491/g.76542 Transcript_30491/m.76542 type:complete len:285 (+) Transcript_30491:120-974(+)
MESGTEVWRACTHTGRQAHTDTLAGWPAGWLAGWRGACHAHSNGTQSARRFAGRCKWTGVRGVRGGCGRLRLTSLQMRRSWSRYSATCVDPLQCARWCCVMRRCSWMDAISVPRCANVAATFSAHAKKHASSTMLRHSSRRVRATPTMGGGGGRKNVTFRLSGVVWAGGAAAAAALSCRLKRVSRASSVRVRAVHSTPMSCSTVRMAQPGWGLNSTLTSMPQSRTACPNRASTRCVVCRTSLKCAGLERARGRSSSFFMCPHSVVAAFTRYPARQHRRPSCETR